MHVAVIADHASPSGGAPAVAIQSAAALAAAGVGVTYISALEAADPRLAASGVRHIGLGVPDIWDRSPVAGAVAGIWNRDAARRLGTAVASLPPRTILHLHQWTRALSPSVFPILLGSGRPLVVTLHDYFLACPNGLYFRFDRGDPCSLAPLSPACVAAPCDPRSMAHKAVRVLRSAATRAAIRGASFVVVHVSDRSRATIGPLLPRTLRQHRIDNPVEVEQAAPAAIGPDAGIAYVGRLTAEKGPVLAAEAARVAGLPILFIGEGLAEPAIQAANPAAEMLGWRSRSEVQAILVDRARALAAPSLWYETGPLTVYEAMAAGLPVVASSRSGAAEKVVDGETGFVVEPRLDALVPAFRGLADADLARRMGKAAYARYWADPPSAERHALALIGLYEAAFGRRSGSGLSAA